MMRYQLPETFKICLFVYSIKKYLKIGWEPASQVSNLSSHGLKKSSKELPILRNGLTKDSLIVSGSEVSTSLKASSLQFFKTTPENTVFPSLIFHFNLTSWTDWTRKKWLKSLKMVLMSMDWHWKEQNGILKIIVSASNCPDRCTPNCQLFIYCQDMDKQVTPMFTSVLFTRRRFEKEYSLRQATQQISCAILIYHQMWIQVCGLDQE